MPACLSAVTLWYHPSMYYQLSDIPRLAIMQHTALSLGSAGVGIGIVDMGYERRLASQLGAHRTPSILGVVNGRFTFFHQAVVRENLRQFIEDLLPQRMVEKVCPNITQWPASRALSAAFTMQCNVMCIQNGMDWFVLLSMRWAVFK